MASEYKQSGVDLEKSDLIKDKLINNILRTHNDQVINNGDGFGGLFSGRNINKNSVLVSLIKFLNFTFIKKDITVFGLGVFVFIILTLWFIFKNIKWVIIPLLGCAASVIIMTGLLGFLGWKVTVISSNFIALMLILNMAMNIHFSVRFLQIAKEF